MASTNSNEEPDAPASLEEDAVKRLAGALLNISDEGFPDDIWGQAYMRDNQEATHSGDCTKCPWTCIRCVVDDYMEQARRLMPFVLVLQGPERAGS